MREKAIYSKNDLFQTLETLKTNRNKRYQRHEFLVEGVRSLNEAVRNGWRIRSWVYDPNRLSDWARGMLAVPTEVNYRLTPELMAALSGKSDVSELMAVVEMRQDDLSSLPLSPVPFLVLFDRPSNKGNLGTMIRSCDGFGADALILTGHAVDLYDPDVVVSAMGSFFKTPVVRVADNRALEAYLADLKARFPDLLVLGTTAHRECPVDAVDLTVPLVLMIGNETMGLNKAFKERCGRLCSIPMAEGSYATSFNVSCAASVLMYEVTRQRNRANEKAR